MSEQPDTSPVPQWDTADRMRKSLREAGIGVQEMADYLGVARNTVSTWINGRIDPSKQTLRLWALRCGISYSWLCHGDAVPCGPEGTRITAGQGVHDRGLNIKAYVHPVSIGTFPRRYQDDNSFPLEMPTAA